MWSLDHFKIIIEQKYFNNTIICKEGLKSFFIIKCGNCSLQTQFIVPEVITKN